MRKEKIKVIVKRPFEAVGHFEEVENTLESFQAIVDGHIEVVGLPEGALLICNEEGKLKMLQPNFYTDGDVIVGTVAVVGQDGEEFGDCPYLLTTWRAHLARWGNRVW